MKIIILLIVLMSSGCLVVRVKDMTSPVKVLTVRKIEHCQVTFMDAQGSILTQEGIEFCGFKEGEIIEK